MTQHRYTHQYTHDHKKSATPYHVNVIHLMLVHIVGNMYIHYLIHDMMMFDVYMWVVRGHVLCEMMDVVGRCMERERKR